MRINKNIIAKDLQGETVLLNMKNGDYFTLNNMGTKVYDHICQGMTIKQITESLFEEYEVGYDQLRNDVLTLVDELRKKDIVLDD